VRHYAVVALQGAIHIISGEDTGTGCRIRLEGEALVPDGEDAWILLLNEGSGGFYVRGPDGNPIVNGGLDDEDPWDYDLHVSDVFYPHKPTYTVLAVVVSLRDSAVLRSLPEGEIPPEKMPTGMLAEDRRRLTLDSDVGCR
jgi:hypothetical protein